MNTTQLLDTTYEKIDHDLTGSLEINQSLCMQGNAELWGAKNSILVAMCALVLSASLCTLRNVPCSKDVYAMIELLESLGAVIHFEQNDNILYVDTRSVDRWHVEQHITSKTRASLFIAGALLARFGAFSIGIPGGDAIGQRPIDYHLQAFKSMGASINCTTSMIEARASALKACEITLLYPSVGATHNSIMASILTNGVTTIINAALEPEVMDLIKLLSLMGASISVEVPATIIITGVTQLQGVDYTIMPDRLEVGTLLLAAAITKGSVHIAQAQPDTMQVFLQVLKNMGHAVLYKPNQCGITFKATHQPQAVSFKTAPYPGFPTDLQAPMVAALTLAHGTSIIQETVYENRFGYIAGLCAMGADITQQGNSLVVKGVQSLHGSSVMASDIRACAALVLAGLAAQGTTKVYGLHHWQRGYQFLEKKMIALGGMIRVIPT